MRISIDDYDDIGYRRQEIERARQEQPREPEIPRPSIHSHVDQLREQAEHRRELKIPARTRTIELAPQDEPREREVETRPRRTREGIAVHIGGLKLREEERALLSAVGRFRVIAVKDIARTIYKGETRALANDLRYLRDHGLITHASLAARGEGRWRTPERLEVVTLTERGVAAARRVCDVAPQQALYDGLVKPREVEHDAQIYRAYIKEAQRIEARGGSNLRVRLDFELKSQAQRAIHAARKVNPSRDIDEVKAQVAASLNLPVVDHLIQIPDARIEYDLDQGSLSGHSDIEVVTAAYHAGHLHAKVQAGFVLYASSGDRATLCARAEGDAHLLDGIFEL